MSKNQKKQRKIPFALWILTGVTGVLTIAFSVGTIVTFNFDDVINKALGLTDVANKKIQTSESDENSEYFKSSYETSEDLRNADIEVAERLTEEGSVLLKNENKALPLAKEAKVTLLGHSSCNTLICGTGSADIKADNAPDLYTTLTQDGIKVNRTVWDYYSNLVQNNQYQTNPKNGDNSIRNGDGGVKGCYQVNEVPWSELNKQAGVSDSMNEYNDAAIMVISRLGGEMYDLPADVDHQGNPNETVNGSGNALELTIQEAEVLHEAKQKFKKVIVLVNSANPIECDFLTKSNSDVDAALWIGYTGYQGLKGVADLLAGVTSPSGRLVDTYCNDNTSAPAMQNFYSEEWTNAADSKYAADLDFNSLDGNKYFNAYQEGIYVGYRYYETRYEDYVTGKGNAGEYNYLNDVAYPFGYGLSYTTFEESDIQFKENAADDSIEVSLKVKNTGDANGKHVVEVYSQSEYTDFDKENGIEKAAVELCGFAKTRELKPGETEEIKITANRSDLVTYDSKVNKTYILDKGDYYLSVGDNAHDALNNILAVKGVANKNLVKNIDGTVSEGKKDNVYKFQVETTDAETYSIGANGEKITNQLDEASLSYYGLDDMTYLSRNNWTGTWPTHQKISLNDKLHDEMTSIKEYEKITVEGEKLPTMGANNGVSLIELRGKDYNDELWNSLLDQLSYEDMAGMIGLGYHGISAVPSVNKPVTKDENGPQGFSGTLTDLTGKAETMCAYTDENIMAGTWNVELMKEVGEHLGEDGLKLGYNGLYGPAMNTHRTAYSGRNFEYYSEDGFLAGKIAAAEVTGIQSKGVYVFIKHFALNDEETNCRSIATFANEQSIREVYLRPFEIAVKEGHAHNVMTAFSRVGVVWSSAHRGLMTNILRGEWGMDGFAVSDYTTTGISVAHGRSTYDPYLAVIAGTDTFDSSDKKSQMKAILKLDYKNDPHYVLAMRESCKRILYITVNSSAMNGITNNTKIIKILTWWQMALIDGIIYFGIATIVLGTIAIVKQVKYVKFKNMDGELETETVSASDESEKEEK